MIGVNRIIDKYYDNYLTMLKQLVALNTVYFNTKGVKKALNYCKQHFEKVLTNYDIYFDKESNLICISKNINLSKNVVYFSAHIDTVPAEKKCWDKHFDPFIPYEDDETIVGRGVSDDKAGVVHQLFLAELIGKYYPNSTNIIFTISYQEEQGGISAHEIGYQIGKKLPLGSKGYLITLENNVQITTPPTLFINYGERSVVTIETTGKLEKIKQFLTENKNAWNPTYIMPIYKEKTKWDIEEQTDGHAATYPREKNRLFQILMQNHPKQFTLKAGKRKSISSVPKIIYRTNYEKSSDHKVIFDLRTMKNIKEITDEINSLKHLKIKFIKKLDHGYDIKNRFFTDEIYQYIKTLTNEKLNIIYEINPGSTDCGTIFKFCHNAFKEKFLPIIMGPGSRSQRKTVPPRLTHGINETYDKIAGLTVIKFITQLLFKMNFICE